MKLDVRLNSFIYFVNPFNNTSIKLFINNNNQEFYFHNIVLNKYEPHITKLQHYHEYILI